LLTQHHNRPRARGVAGASPPAKLPSRAAHHWDSQEASTPSTCSRYPRACPGRRASLDARCPHLIALPPHP
jgi:hypothetical protein